jgi:hypothetical protein
MGLFQKLSQRITLSSADQQSLVAFMSLLKAENIKDAKIAAIRQLDDEWQCAIHCKHAEEFFYQKVLPMLYSSAENQSFTITLELDDKSEVARRCPREIMVSFDLKSRYAFGDKDDNEFIRKLHMSIVQGVHGKAATVSYYIVSGGVVTMSIPCLELTKMEKHLQDEFKNYGIKRFTINIVDRERA